MITFDVSVVSFTDRSGKGTFSICNLLKCYLNFTLQACLTDGNVAQVKNERLCLYSSTRHSRVDTYYVYQVFALCWLQGTRLLHTYYNIITVVHNSIRLHSLHMGNFISVASIRLWRSLYHGGLLFASILLS